MSFHAWEYAEISEERGSKNVVVKFSHRQGGTGGFWEILRQLGDEGWELVGVGHAPWGDRGNWRYVFKRPLT